MPAGLAPVPRSGRGCWPTVREPCSGGWQHNADLPAETAIRNPTIFSCATLIAETIGKCQLRLVEQVDPDVWVPTSNPAYSPVLRKPNRYQTIQKFLEAWLSVEAADGERLHPQATRPARRRRRAVSAGSGEGDAADRAGRGDLLRAAAPRARRPHDGAERDRSLRRAGARDHPRPDGAALPSARRRVAGVRVRDGGAARRSRSRTTARRSSRTARSRPA